MPDFSRLLDAHRSAILHAGTAYIVLLSVAPILMTPYRHDDTINRTTPDVLVANGQPLLQALFTEFRGQVLAWMTNQGRFFPGSFGWTMSVFAVLQTRLAYKLFLCLLALVMVILVARLVATLTRTPVAGVVAAVGLSMTLTLRLWADGLDSFAGLLPLTIGCAVGSTLLLLHGRGKLSIVLAVVLWTAALVTYEVAFVVTPVLCVVVWLARGSRVRALALFWPTLADGIFVLYLRVHATSEAPAYQTNFELAPVASTYVKQTLAALPLAQEWFPGSAGLSVSPSLVALMIAAIGIPTVLVLACVHRARPDPSWRSLGILTLVAATFWLVPPVLVAITLRWQSELPAGQGYLSVVWGYVGVGMLLAAAWLALAKRCVQRPAWDTRAALASVTLCVGLVAALNVAQSLAIAEQLTFTVL